MTKAEALEIAENAIWRDLDELRGNTTAETRREFFTLCRDALAKSIRMGKSKARKLWRLKKEKRKALRDAFLASQAQGGRT